MSSYPHISAYKNKKNGVNFDVTKHNVIIKTTNHLT